MRFEVFAKSIRSDPWVTPILVTDSIEDAIAEAYDWFDKEGWYSQVIDTTHGEVIFVDYHFVDDWELMY